MKSTIKVEVVSADTSTFVLETVNISSNLLFWVHLFEPSGFAKLKGTGYSGKDRVDTKSIGFSCLVERDNSFPSLLGVFFKLHEMLQQQSYILFNFFCFESPLIFVKSNVTRSKENFEPRLKIIQRENEANHWGNKLDKLVEWENVNKW